MLPVLFVFSFLESIIIAIPIKAKTGAKLENISFVGDRLYTDVKTGVNNGAHGILVLSGEVKIEDVAGSDVVPDAIFDDLKEMAEMMKTF